MAYVPPRTVRQDKPPVIVIGAGGHGKVLIQTLRLLGRHILFVTDESASLRGGWLEGAEVRGTDELIRANPPDSIELVNGVGSTHLPSARMNVFNRFKYRGYRFATVIHPSASVADSANIAQGAQIMSGVIVQPNALIGANTILNTRGSIDHDCVIGAHTHLAPGVTLSGGVTIGQMCHIGTGVTVIQSVDIGHETMVGAGAVVIRDLPPGVSVCGVPAVPMRGGSADRAS